MEEQNIVENFINNEENAKNQSTDELKQRLKEQIHQLKSIILQMEWNLDMIKFGNTKCVFPSSTSSDLNTKIPDVNIQLETELHKYSGLHCVKFSAEEYVFHFTPPNKYDRENIFAVQILNNQGKGTLGKWVMPMGIDLNDIVSEYPITDLRNIPNFLRICKQHVNAYFVRQQQYIILMNTLSRLKNCNLQTNIGYTQINFELLMMYNKNTDSYIDIVIYLFYNIDAARPNKIKVESLTQDELDKDTQKHLETSLVCFKKFDLHIAFEEMLNMKAFTWIKQDDEDSPLRISSLSDSSDEGYLNDFSLQRKSFIAQKSKSRMRKKRKRKNQDKLSTPKISSTREYSKRDISLHNKKQDLQNVKEQPVRQQDNDIMDPTPNINDFKQKKLKQTRLKFRSNDSELQNNNNNATSSNEPVFKKKQTSPQIDKPYTSTPVKPNEHLFNLINDISDITVDVAKNDNPEEDQIQNDTSAKLLQNKIEKKIRPSTRSKAQSSKTVVHKKTKRQRKNIV
ncbi:PREDICTED: uncharacterized protein LOC108550743 [Eufriesea mexicana]|uniref:uncharacterized protein LOC108550743 n=1 Tax=Eufriesea mexicana TaxID=516756 RepID=UPI00083C257F|nr:PREDICTED: uncharacterized protein LOC108550743 [Eufriesea mexicana]